MGWLFTRGLTRKDLIADRSKDWERDTGEMQVKTSASPIVTGAVRFPVSLWAVWERTFTKDGQTAQPTERWITCDLLRHQKDYGWGYKDMDESMHPYYYSCPLGYLEMVPIDQYGGNAEWRECVRRYHAQQAEKRQQRCSA